MDGDTKLFLMLVALGTLCVLSISACNMHENEVKRELQKNAIDSGYSQATLPGVSGAFWVKDGKKLED